MFKFYVSEGKKKNFSRENKKNNCVRRTVMYRGNKSTQPREDKVIHLWVFYRKRGKKKKNK